MQQSGLGTSRSSNISEQDVGMLNSSIHTTTTGTAPFSEIEEDLATVKYVSLIDCRGEEQGLPKLIRRWVLHSATKQDVPHKNSFIFCGRTA